MTQQELGEKLGMAQTWVSKLENPDYGKMTVATLLRLAEAFDTDLEIRFRPFSWTVETLPKLTSEYFEVPGFDEELASGKLDLTAEGQRVAVPGLSPLTAQSGVTGIEAPAYYRFTQLGAGAYQASRALAEGASSFPFGSKPAERGLELEIERQSGKSIVAHSPVGLLAAQQAPRERVA